MKKSLCSILAVTFVFTSSLALASDSDEPMVIAPAPEKTYSVVVENEKLNLNENDVYTKNDKIMVPLRAVAEKLGFDVEWENDTEEVKLDNKEVNTKISIGNDLYYMASSTAIGMSAPTPLGAAPELKGDKTYVPADMFNVLYCKTAYTVKDNVITFFKDGVKDDDSVQIPNPFTEYKTIEEAKKALNFDAPVPSSVLDGYEIAYVSTLGNDFLQIVYEKGENEITYRVAVSNEDISGDYNVYKDVKTVKIAGNDVTVKQNVSDASFSDSQNATWKNGNLSFSVFSNAKISDDALSALISSIK